MSASAGSYTRTDAFLSLTSPLGPNVLIPVSFGGSEEISQPFHFTIDAVSDQASIDANSLLNKAVTITLTTSEQPQRVFNGIVSRFVNTGAAPRGMYSYTLQLVPSFALMTHTADCRVFQQVTVMAVIQELLGNFGVTAVTPKVSYQPTHDYIIQYNETDFHFISRLMQEEGYFYFFEHTTDAHTLIIADANTAFSAVALDSMYVGGASDRVPDALSAWSASTALASGKVQLTDYDHTAPSKPLDNAVSTTLKAAGAPKRDVYRWPARTWATGDVSTKTKHRIEAAEAHASLLAGESFNESFCPGGKFTLTEDPLTGASGTTFVLARVSHAARDDSWLTKGGVSLYSNSFTCFTATVPWRERLTHPRPIMAGIFSGLVIGPAGNEIYTDEYGRVKVWLYFDHLKDATGDGDKSIWVRVIQPWAGSADSSNWGFHFLPRVDSEVAVAFMDSDPDRPVVVGGLYNGSMKPLWSMPDNKNKSGIRTRSTLKGGTDNYSEFSFDDTKGSELVFLHCEKDHTIEVENNESLTVDNCRIHHVKVDETINIDRDQKIKIGRDQTIDVVNSRTTTIDQADETLTVKLGNMTTKVTTGNHQLTVSTGNQTNTVSTGNYDLKVDTGNITTKAGMGNIATRASMGNISTKADLGNIANEASLGNVSIKADVGGVTIEALQSIELKVMGNSLKIDPVGVTINGIMVKVTGTAMTQVTAAGMLQLQGGIVMVN